MHPSASLSYLGLDSQTGTVTNLVESEVKLLAKLVKRKVLSKEEILAKMRKIQTRK